MKALKFIVASALIFSTAACVSTARSDASSRDLPLMSVRLDPEQPLPLVLFEKVQIQARDGCVYVVGDPVAQGAAAVWPDYYEVFWTNGMPQGITDRRSGKKLEFGVVTNLGGGSMTGYRLLTDNPSCKGERNLFYIP